MPVLSLIPLQNWVLIYQPYWTSFWYFKQELDYLQLWWIVADLLEVSRYYYVEQSKIILMASRVLSSCTNEVLHMG